jgi:hypothetical protein
MNLGKKELYMAIGVIIGTAVFKKYLSAPLSSALPTNAV